MIIADMRRVQVIIKVLKLLLAYIEAKKPEAR